MMYKDLDEKEIPRAGFVLLKHVNMDKTGWIESCDQSIINAMHEYASIKCKPLNDLIFSFEQQLEDRNISIQAIEDYYKLKEACFLRGKMIEELDKKIEELEGYLLRRDEMIKDLDNQITNLKANESLDDDYYKH